jgi:hypothetical protein
LARVAGRGTRRAAHEPHPEVGYRRGGEDVEVPALDERGEIHDIEQLPDSVWH